MAGRSGLAYDLSRFEPSKQTELKPKIQKVPRKRPQDYINPVKIVTLLVCIILITGTMLYSRAQLAEVNDQIVTLNGEYGVAQSEQIRLKMELEKQLSMNQVEEYAKSELGMTELNKSQITYFTLTEGNQIEMKEEESFNIIKSIENFFSDLKEFIFGS